MVETSEARDKAVVEETEAARARLAAKFWDLYYSDQPTTETWAVFGQLQAADDAWSTARGKLIQEGTLSTEVDLKNIRTIKAEIEKAKTTNALLVAAARLVGFIIGIGR